MDCKLAMRLLPGAIIFDFDGTLVDSEKITFQLAVPIITRYVGRDFTEEELNSIKGKVWKNAFKKWLPDDHENLYQEIVDNWREVDPVLPLYPEVRKMLNHLHGKGIPMAIASSRERNLISRDLERHSIDGYFETVVGQEDTVRHKPDPDPLLLAADSMDVKKEDCIYIGDQPWDILASKAAGMISGAAIWGEGVLESLSPAGPDFVFRSPDDIAYSLFDGDPYRRDYFGAGT